MAVLWACRLEQGQLPAGSGLEGGEVGHQEVESTTGAVSPSEPRLAAAKRSRASHPALSVGQAPSSTAR
jgi:hypothetical protein